MKALHGAPAPRRGRFLLYALTGVAAILLGLMMTSRVGFLASRRLPTAVAIGALAPDFTLPKAGEVGELSLHALRGRPVLLNFFCGCGECRDVAMVWVERAKEVGDAQLISVAHDHTLYNPVTVKNFRWGTGFQWPMLADVGSDVSLAWHSIDCPRVWLLDSEGVIRYQSPGRGTPAAAIVDGCLAALRGLKG